MSTKITFAFYFCILISCTEMKIPSPKAKKVQKSLSKHNDIRIDNYYWLNQRENPDVIKYLKKENKYTSKNLKVTEKTQKILFDEMKSRIKKDDNSVPYFFNGYWYVTKYVKGKNYPIYIRKKMSLDASEEILIDVNKLCKDYPYCQVSGLSISPDNTKISYGMDTLSRRIYSIYIKDLKTGKNLKDKIEGVSPYATWSSDSMYIFYTSKDSQTLRNDKIFRHQIGKNQKKDELVFHETDDSFSTFVYPSKSREYIIIGSTSTSTSEYQFLKSSRPLDNFNIIQPRYEGLEYSVDQFEDNFYIRTNIDGSKNFKLVKAPIVNPGKKFWSEIIPHNKEILLEDVEIFKDFFVISERKKGLLTLRVINWDFSNDYSLEFGSETYSASIGVNTDFYSKKIRYNFSSLTNPNCVKEYDTELNTHVTLKEQEIVGGQFNKQNYISERIWANSEDGKKIPISLVRHISTKLSKETPILLYAYGSYGITVDPTFSSIRLSLLDRGFVFAIAHIRGGEYLGRQWYEDGKMLNKKNTFNDFIACSKFLINENMTSSKHLYAMGGSAGGLLMGVIINMEPELYNGVIAAVPFVDVVTTMLDESIPLTTGEYDEWGNPNEKKFYNYMKSYSPYDNVTKKNYPNILVTSGFHDSQVQYWEPTKWVAKLRDFNLSDNLILLHTNMDYGHSGASGRFEPLKEIAMEYSFLLMLDKKL